MTRVVAAVLTCMAIVGCSQRVTSTTPRTALEQLVLSGAVDRALERFKLPEIKGKKVHVDLTNLKAYDVEYVRVAVRARFARMGAVLTAKADDADYVAEVASGGLGIESKLSVIGLPSFPVPSSPIGTPEAPFHRTSEQTGIFKLLIFVHKKGEFVAADHYYAKCDRDESFLLWWRYQGTDNVREGWERADAKLQDSQTDEKKD